METKTISAEDVGIGVDLSPPLSPLTFSLYDSFLSSHCSSCFSLLPPTPPHPLYCSAACSLVDDSPTVSPPDLSPILSTSDIRAALRLLNSISSSSAAASLPHRFGGLLTNHRRLMADSSFSVAIRRAASFISAVLRSDRGNTVLEEAAICAVLTNAVEVQDRAGVAIGIAVYGSRFSWINHSCSPNACYRFVISPPPHSTTTSSFQETLPRITNTDKEHFSSNYEGAVRYGPKVIVRSIKGIKSGEEITVSYIDLLQPTGLRQSDLWSKYRFICNCGRCAASPPAYVDSILEGVVALDHDELTTVGHHDGAATVGKMTSHINKAIDDFLSDDIDPATCCEKIEGVLHHGILDSSSLRLHPSHHAALHAYITLASAYRIRSIDSETDDFGRAFEMSRIGAAYSLFLAGVSHHLVSAELSFAISAANFWTRAGESLLELASKFLMESSGEYDDDDVKCSKCLMLVENHGEIKENFNQILKCAVTDSDSSQVAWSFLTRGCPYLQKFKSSVDFSFTGNHCKREESKSVDQRVSILLLSFHCLLYADLLTDLCYGRKSHSVS
ncbi:BnaA09g52100D [Brassica napus]|uniref:BnaA09g52100D protein n=1 Tax=Brassica napus TaxID=3708 RepID=A0A078IRK1_BRANA|nr:protein SET DOMAIN GROUP 41-like [Brassica napus]CDY51723.1 BnaA09g52100D [Brassica napus]